MAQFTIYTSEDRSGPGPITGTTGSLLTVLNACLINGYGTGSYYKAPAGWLKPCADSGSVYGGFQLPSGSGFSLFVNDNSPSSGYASEAWLTGWQYLSSSAPPAGVGTHIGVGNGQFPLPIQLLTYGYVNCKKSTSITNTTQRTWILAADAYTMYLWIFNAESAGAYGHVGFGDFYSLAGTSDKGRCLIFGRNLSAGSGGDYTDCISGGSDKSGYTTVNNGLQNPFMGHFAANSVSGMGGSIAIAKKGDSTMSTNNGLYSSTQNYNTMDGYLAYPNPYDGSMRLSPIWVVEPAGVNIRGRYRGIYQAIHSSANFTTGQTVQGSGTYAGKTFMIIKTGTSGGFWVLETSNTLDTN